MLHLSESTTTVLHILRGGLNFGLRQSLARAYGWNKHASAFISAQRARQSENPEDWYITENAYQKVFLPNDAAVVFGDVVATGTSLSYALHQMINIGETEKKRVSSFVFFTIGGPRSEEILAEIDALCRTRFPNYSGSTVIYFEGRFAVAEAGTPLSIKYTGTDLIRRDCIMAPEFINSQYDNPLFPLERCTIYDAGSRAFWVPEYIEDVLDYWEKTAMLARDGFTFRRLLQERCPDLDPDRFPNCSLLDLCHQQIEQCKRVLTCAE